MTTPAEPTTPSVGELRALASVLAERYNIARRGGLTFSDDRDLYKALGYKRELRVEDYRARYYRNAVAARIIEALPKATWRGGGELVEDDDPDVETAFEQAWDDLDKRLGVWSALMRADILSGIGHYGTLLVGAAGKLEEELPKMKGPDDVAYLAAYAEDDAIVQTIVEDPMDPRFGLPLLYQFKRMTGSSFQPSRLVHWTRVIHVSDALDDQVRHRPRLERVWNLLDDLEKVTGAGAEAFWLRAHQGYVAEIDPEAKIDEADVRQMKDHIEEFAHQIRRTIGLRGTKFKALGSDVANFASPADAILTQIAGGCEIPKRILTGSEMGELASSQDTANWNVRVHDRRTQFAEPFLIRPLVDRLVKYGALPKPADYEVHWPEMRNLSDEERAMVAAAWASLNGAMGAVVVTPDEIRTEVLGRPPLADVDVDPALMPPAPEPPPGQPDAEAGAKAEPGEPEPPEPDDDQPKPNGAKPKAGPSTARAAARRINGKRRPPLWSPPRPPA